MTKIECALEEEKCVSCGVDFVDNGCWICTTCEKSCEITKTVFTEDLDDVKSICCNVDVVSYKNITCSKFCHDVFVNDMIKKNGIYKRIVDIETGITHKVPTQLIIEKGIKQQDLKHYPEWV